MTARIFASIIAAAFFCAASSALGQEKDVTWRTYADGKKEAKQKKRFFFVLVGRTDFFIATFLKEKTLTDPRIVRLMEESFIPAWVDARKEPKLVEALAIDVFPTMIVVDLDGKTVYTHFGFREAEGLERDLRSLLAGGKKKTENRSGRGR